MRASAGVLLAMALQGCAAWPLAGPDASDHLDYYAAVINMSPAGRERAWKEAQAADRSDAADLRQALLRSVPGHAGSDPDLAASELEDLLVRQPADEIGAVARARLLELQNAGECREEVTALKRRLADVVNIERNLEMNN